MRTEGKQRPVRSAKLTRFCSVQCRCRRTVRYRSKETGTKASMAPSWAAKQPAGKRRALGAPYLWQETLLRKSAKYGKLVVARRRFPRPRPDMRARRFRRVCYLWVLVLRPRGIRDARTANSARTASVTHDPLSRKPLSRIFAPASGGAV